jgi:hypothetical protein
LHHHKEKHNTTPPPLIMHPTPSLSKVSMVIPQSDNNKNNKKLGVNSLTTLHAYDKRGV